jgi:FkbM family methyltransferase
MNIITSLDALARYRSVSLYGAGSLGAFSLRKIKAALPRVNVQSFIDDRKKGTFEGVPVLNFETYLKAPADMLLITSSYWKDISKRINGSGVPFRVLDLLAGESTEKITELQVKEATVRFATPNNFLREVALNSAIIEPATNAWIEGFRKEAVFYDVGASCGIYSIYASVAAQAKVYAFEPDSSNHSILVQNTFLNKELIRNNVTAFNIGLGSAPAILPLLCQEYLAGAHGKIFKSLSREQQSTMEVGFIQNTVCDTLDGFIARYGLPKPEYLKIDVDGFEEKILEGAAETLKSIELREILIETDVSRIDSIKDSLADAGFSLQEEQRINEITGFAVEGVHNYLFSKHA